MYVACYVCVHAAVVLKLKIHIPYIIWICIDSSEEFPFCNCYRRLSAVRSF